MREILNQKPRRHRQSVTATICRALVNSVVLTSELTNILFNADQL
jgi:hypothetical protein